MTTFELFNIKRYKKIRIINKENIEIKIINNNSLKETLISFLKKNDSNFFFYQKVYYKISKEKIVDSMYDFEIYELKKKVQKKIKSLFIDNYKIKLNIYKFMQYFLKKKDFNFLNFKNININFLDLLNYKSNYSFFHFFNMIKQYIYLLNNFLEKKESIEKVQYLFNKYKIAYLLQKTLEKLNKVKQYNLLNYVIEEDDEELLDKINTYVFSNIFNLFIIKFKVNKNNIFAVCYSVEEQENKKYKKKRLFMSSAGRVQFEGSNKKTRPALERFSRKFFVKLKDFQYKKNRQTMKEYNLIFEYENFYAKTFLEPFFECIPEKYYKTKYSIIKYKLPHNQGITKKKKT
jgi:hypothetical protein